MPRPSAVKSSRDAAHVVGAYRNHRNAANGSIGITHQPFVDSKQIAKPARWACPTVRRTLGELLLPHAIRVFELGYLNEVRVAAGE